MGRLGKNRTRDKRLVKKKIFIFCEGEKTEPLYFEGFKIDMEKSLHRNNVAIVIRGTGFNTQSLVDYAAEMVDKNPDYDPKVDKKWLVFDEDTVKGGKYDNAIKSGVANKWQVAYSNECFEIWYLLHFSYFITGSGRDNYFKKLVHDFNQLNPTLKLSNWRKAGKKLGGIYEMLKSRQPHAIKNAKKIYEENERLKSPKSQQKPSTSVHLLVESLNKLIAKEGVKQKRG